MSRLLQKGEGKDFGDTANYVNFITVKAVPKAMSAEEIEQAALDDEEMKELRRAIQTGNWEGCLLYTSPSPRDLSTSRMPSSA